MNLTKTLLLVIALTLTGAVSTQAVSAGTLSGNPGAITGSDPDHPFSRGIVDPLPVEPGAPGILNPDVTDPVLPDVGVINGPTAETPVWNELYPAIDLSPVPVLPDPVPGPAPVIPNSPQPSDTSSPISVPVPAIPYMPLPPSGDLAPAIPDVPGYPSGVPVPGPTSLPPAFHSPQSEQNVVDANNRFGFDLYKNLSKDPDSSGGNLFFSPFSLSSALALVYEGARGTTADEICSVFHFPEDDGVRRQGFADINAGIISGDSGYVLRTANALWAETRYPFLPEYVSTAEQFYSAPVTNLNFITSPEDSRKIINTWVEDRTNGKIQDLLPAGTIDPSTRLVITNAVYFKGTWVKQFDANETQVAEFTITPGTTGPGTTTPVQMMQRTDKDAIFNYTETDRFQVIEMPYTHESGKQLSMLVILPKGTDLASVEHSLDTTELTSLIDSLVPERVNVYFPKFRLETTYSLSDTLAAMGMPTAFSGSADFSGMDGTRSLSVTYVIHKAFIDVNEEGTEAAAATGAVMSLTAFLPEEPVLMFRADHPFLFLIIDNETGNILFMGRLVNPNG
jgi:serpin B